MKKKIGLYISTEGKNIYRTVYSMIGETIMPPTTIEEEIISVSELELRDYLKIIDGMLDPVFPKKVLTSEAFSDTFETFRSMIGGYEDFNLLYGRLMRREVFRDMPADDHTEEYNRS